MKLGQASFSSGKWEALPAQLHGKIHLPWDCLGNMLQLASAFSELVVHSALVFILTLFLMGGGSSFLNIHPIPQKVGSLLRLIVSIYTWFLFAIPM